MKKTTLLEYGTEDCLLTSRERLVEIGKDVWRAGESRCCEKEEKGTKGTDREEIYISCLNKFLKTVYRKVAKIVVAIEL